MAFSNSQFEEQEDFNDEDWTRVTDPQERKRIQNRLAQRNYRKNLKQRIEELERVAGEHEKSTSSLSKENLRATSRNQRQKKNSKSTSPSLPGQNQPGHVSDTSHTSDSGQQHLNHSLRHSESVSQVTTLMNDSHTMQYLPTEALFKHQQAWNDIQHDLLSSLDGIESPDLHAGFDFNFPSCNSLGVDSMHLSSSESQFTPGTRTPASKGGSPSWSHHSSAASSNAVSRTSSKRQRKSEDNIDTGYDVEEPKIATFSKVESEDLIPQTWKPSLTGEEAPKPSPPSSEIRSSRPKIRRNSTTNSSVASGSTLATAALSTRLTSALASIKALGFGSIEDLLTQFWTADLSDRPSLAGTQRLSRRRELPHMLSKVREFSNDWSDWESQGWLDEVTRSAEGILKDECRRYLLKENNQLLSHSHLLSPEEVLTFKNTFQTELPNLYALMDTLSDASGRVGIGEVGETEAAVNAISILLQNQTLCP